MAYHLKNVSILTFFLLSNTAFFFSQGCYTRLFSFGDSLIDNGNEIQVFMNSTTLAFSGRLPYGQTYFHQPTGRFCDGRIIIDFLAENFGLPLLLPFLSGRSAEDFEQGANFAIGAGTARDPSIGSIKTQIRWFKEALALISLKSNYKDVMEKSFFLVGEIGINDYQLPLPLGVPLDMLRTIVPDVINKISLAIQDLIALGAKTLVVPGSIPSGCTPLFLTLQKSQNQEDYNELGCLKPINELMEYHNQLLIEELTRLRGLYPNVQIFYADYYRAYINLLQSPQQYGFVETQVSCCGSGGPNNFNLTSTCGNAGSTVCKDPSKYVSWDGIHLTEAAYKVVTDGVLRGLYLDPPVSLSC